MRRSPFLMIIAFVLFALFARAARADEYVGLHTVSFHGDACSNSVVCTQQGGWNQKNFGAYYRTNNFIVGAYDNSINRTSVYAAALLQTTGHKYIEIGVGAGVISGYVKVTAHAETITHNQYVEGAPLPTSWTTTTTTYTTRSTVLPLAFVYMSIHATKSVNLNLTYVPPYKENGNVVNVTVEHRF